MTLALRPRQRHAVVELLNLAKNSKAKSGTFLPLSVDPDAEAEEANTYKVLVLDGFTHDVIAPLVTLKELRDHGVTLHLRLEKDREEIPDTPGVYFVEPTIESVRAIGKDFQRGLYDSYHLNFSGSLPSSALEELATTAAKSGADSKVKCVRDQYLGYVSLEDNLFDLGMESGYKLLHDPRSSEREVERLIARTASGLYSVCATLGLVPVIRSQRGGAAEMIAKELDSRIREALTQRDNPFEGGVRMALAGSSVQRPLLCLFDRNFDLTAMLQHSWTYQPLVHDVLNMRLNRVEIDADGPTGAATGAKPKSYTLEDADPFWGQNAAAQFPKVAEEVEAELAKYKEAIKRVNAQAAMADDDADALSNSTAKLADAVQSLPELQEKKKIIDKHTNIATALLGNIKQRGLDEYYAIEEDLLVGKGDKPSVMSLLQATGRGNAADKVRLAIVYTLAATEGMSAQDAEEIEGALRASGAETAALTYVKRMMSLNAQLKNMSGDGAASGHRRADSSQGNILEWADKLYGQSIHTITKGVRNLLSGERVLPISVAFEALMGNQPSPETAEYAYLDPRSPHGKPHVPREGDAAFHDGICFVVGGGNYLEYQSLLELKSRERASVRSVVYGTTSLCTGEAFLSTLAVLGGSM